MARKYCDDCGITHTALMCFNKPRLPIRPPKGLNRSQRKAKFMAANPPDDYGLWRCYLKISPACIIRMDKDQLTVEHVKPVGSYPELKDDLDNMKPACFFCNTLKGSRSIEALAKTYPHLEPLVVDSD